MEQDSYRSGFPEPDEAARIIEAPTYHPSMEQFQDPISYIQSIRPDAEPYGMCTIVPPDGWKVRIFLIEYFVFYIIIYYSITCFLNSFCSAGF